VFPASVITGSLKFIMIVSEPPFLVQAPALADFWQENFKVQVDARSGTLRIHLAEEPPRKRRRTKDTPQRDLISIAGEGQAEPFELADGVGMDIDIAAGGKPT
jgi:hypothetical protein